MDSTDEKGKWEEGEKLSECCRYGNEQNRRDAKEGKECPRSGLFIDRLWEDNELIDTKKIYIY